MPQLLVWNQTWLLMKWIHVLKILTSVLQVMWYMNLFRSSRKEISMNTSLSSIRSNSKTWRIILEFIILKQIIFCRITLMNSENWDRLQRAIYKSRQLISRFHQAYVTYLTPNAIPWLLNYQMITCVSQSLRCLAKPLLQSQWNYPSQWQNLIRKTS